MIHKKYYELLKKQEELLNKKNKKADFIMAYMTDMKILSSQENTFHLHGSMI